MDTRDCVENVRAMLSIGLVAAPQSAAALRLKATSRRDLLAGLPFCATGRREEHQGETVVHRPT
jgi:hypothetical protein